MRQGSGHDSGSETAGNRDRLVQSGVVDRLRIVNVSQPAAASAVAPEPRPRSGPWSLVFRRGR